MTELKRSSLHSYTSSLESLNARYICMHDKVMNCNVTFACTNTCACAEQVRQVEPSKRRVRAVASSDFNGHQRRVASVMKPPISELHSQTALSRITAVQRPIIAENNFFFGLNVKQNIKSYLI